MANKPTTNSVALTHSRETTLDNAPELNPSPNSGTSTASSSSSSSSSYTSARTMSGPFQYADDLDTDSDGVLNFYLNSVDADLPDASQERAEYKPLLRYIKQSNLDQNFKNGISSVTTCIVEMGDLLFPPPVLLDGRVTRRVGELTEYIINYTTSVVDYLKMRIEKSEQAFRRLPNPCVTDSTEQLALSIAAWSAILDHLHKPSGRESYIFRQISAIYSSHVYLPFLQFHRVEPNHNMWQLESQLMPISLLLQDAEKLAKRADSSVRVIEEEFELTMSSRSTPTAEGYTGVFGEQKRQHNPSKSAPVVLGNVQKPVTHQRENTL